MQFRVLGSFEVVADGGRVIDVGGPKQRAVLAMLCLDVGRISPLDRMIGELWEEPPPTAAATIQTYISNLRRILEPDRLPRSPSTLLVSRAPGYVLDVPIESIDAERFRLAVAAAHLLLGSDPAGARRALDDALTLWRGPALADFAYEPFAQADIHRLEELRLAAVEDRVEAGLRLGDHAAAVGELEALVRDHPLRERMWGQLMIGLYRSGRQSEALRAYQRCSDLLVEGLGLVPSPALRDLEQRILTQDPTLDLSALYGSASLAPSSPLGSVTSATTPSPRSSGTSAPADAAGDGGTTHLVGRADEMTVIRDAIDRAVAGRGTLLFLEGEPGAGKSRLLEEAVRVAHDRGLATAVSRCFEVGETPPFWPFVQATRALGGQLSAARLYEAAGGHLAELTPLFPELGIGNEASTRAALSPHRVANAMVHALRNLTATTPVLIGIDDVHAADPDSVTMLVALADAIADIGVVAVATCRVGAILEDEHLDDVVAALVRLPQARRRTLEPLDVDEVAQLVADVTTQEVDPAIAAALHDRTDGNAFYTVELARLLAAEGLLEPGRERWTDVVPSSVRDVIRRRLARMPDETLQVLRVAAMAGRSFDVDVLARVTGVDLDVLLDELDLAVACGTLTEADRPGRFRFTHVLVRDTIAGALNSLRQARLHGQLADALEELHGHDPEALSEVAYHAVEARSAVGVERALAALRTASAAATAAGAFAGAEAMHRRRLALAEELPDSSVRVEHEQQALGDLAAVVVARRGYQSDDLVPIHRRLSELAERSSPEIAVQTAIGRWVFHTTRGELDEAEAVHAQLTAVLAGAPDPIAPLIVDHSGGILSLHRGDVSRALERFGRCEELLAIIDPGDSGTVLYPGLDQSVVVSHTNFLSIAQWLAGDTAASNATLDRGAAAARRGGRPYSVAFALTFRAYLAAMRHDVERARVDGRHAAEVCEEHGFGFLASMVDVVTGWARAAMGDTDAVPTLEAIDELLVKGRTGGFSTVSWGLLADAHRRLERTDSARELLGRALDFSDRGGEMIWRPELERLWWTLDDDHEDPEPLRKAAALADRLGLVAVRHRCESMLDRQA